MLGVVGGAGLDDLTNIKLNRSEILVDANSHYLLSPSDPARCERIASWHMFRTFSCMAAKLFCRMRVLPFLPLMIEHTAEHFSELRQ